MDARKNWIYIVLGFLLLIALICVTLYFIIQSQLRQSDAEPQYFPTSPPPATATLTPAFSRIVITPLPTLAQAAPLYPAAGSLWRFLKINNKDVGYFESVDSPGQTLRAKCQQPEIPPPGPGTLYTLDAQGILTPLDNNPRVQRFKVK
jgi:hypothetical protein